MKKIIHRIKISSQLLFKGKLPQPHYSDEETPAFIKYRDFDWENNLQYRDRDYFRCGIDFYKEWLEGVFYEKEI